MDLIIDTYTPSEELVNTSMEYQAIFGEQTLKMVYRFRIIENYLRTATRPHVFIVLLKTFLETIHSKDPSRFHFEVVRATLAHIDKNALKNDQSVDFLARSFVKACNALNKVLKIPKELNDLIIDVSTKIKNPTENFEIEIFELLEVDEQFEEQFFDKNGRTIWDKAYLRALKSIGTKGAEKAKEFAEKFNSKLSGWDPHFWFLDPDTSKDHFFLSPAFIILAGVLWEDVVNKRSNFANKNVPALTTSVNEPIRKILCPGNQISDQGEEKQIHHKGALVGTITIPTIPSEFISVVSHGVYKLNSVTGHRLFRYLVGGAFERAIHGHDDPRVLKLDRGASDIAEQLELKGKQHITNIKEIVHAMAYFEFRDRVISGNLIQLSKYKSPITGREDEGYLITIGTSLLSYRTFESYRRGECGLLIPLLKDPPLVGSNRSHAGQYLLQMNIMELFSKKSIELFTNGAIEIPEAQWQEFMRSCGLSLELLPKVTDRWTRDGDDGAMFLEKVEDNFYTLGSAHVKERDFLIRQGELRIAQSKRGKASAIAQKMAKKKTHRRQDKGVNL